MRGDDDYYDDAEESVAASDEEVRITFWNVGWLIGWLFGWLTIALQVLYFDGQRLFIRVFSRFVLCSLCVLCLCFVCLGLMCVCASEDRLGSQHPATQQEQDERNR